jgi:FAD/FMN-containing dehydrogenase
MVTEAWQEWAPPGPDELAATLLLGAGGATITGAYIRPEREAERLMAQLPEPAEARLERGTYAANLERLRDIKARYDPGGVFGRIGG